MDELADLDEYWHAKGAKLVAAARARKVDFELAGDVAAWPDPWVAAELLTYDRGTEHELAAGQILQTAHVLQAKPAGDVVALLERAHGAVGDDRIAALEEAWRACFAPELADALEALDAHREAPAMPVAKKKKDTEVLWAAAAERAPARSVFGGVWPKQWRDAQRRMRPLYRRPRSPLFAAAAIDFAQRDPLPYTSIASTTYWQAHAWFIAEQADVRQLAALEALEERIARMGGNRKDVASAALRALRPRELPPRARALLAELAVPAKPAPRAELSLASPEERSVAADQLLLAGDPRGELITVQTQLRREPTPELVKRQAALLKKHAKTWVPNTVHRDTCVFRDGVPVAGHLIARSDPELASMAGSQALATFETLIIDDTFAMGDLAPATIANVVASLPNLRFVITTDTGAVAIARGAPTALERVAIASAGAAALDGPGLPALARVDVAEIPASWSGRPWFTRLTAIGTRGRADWDRWRTAGLSPAVVFGDTDHLYGRTGASTWELWADRDGHVTVRHQVGSTAASLVATLDRVRSWERVASLRVPANFVAAVADIVRRERLAVEPIAPVEPICDGVSLDMLPRRRKR